MAEECISLQSAQLIVCFMASLVLNRVFSYRLDAYMYSGVPLLIQTFELDWHSLKTKGRGHY